jgi:methionyl aminopeptidase
MMIILKRKNEIELMRQSGHFVAQVLDTLEDKVKPGITTWDLETIANDMVEKAGVKPAFKNYRVGNQIFPCCLCISVNEEVVHGIPSQKRVLEEGDIVSVDFGVRKNGYFGDSARTFSVGKIKPELQLLLDVTKESLHRAIEIMTPSHRLQDIGATIQTFVEKHELTIVRDFVGHGIGKELHEEPQVPNYGTFGKGLRLKAGMVLAIEPMVNLGSENVEVCDDGWTVVTCDRQPSAHFEHTIAITHDGPEILTL